MSKGEARVLEFGECEYPFMTIIPKPLLSRVEAKVKVRSMGQIKLFNFLLVIIINIK